MKILIPKKIKNATEYGDHVSFAIETKGVIGQHSRYENWNCYMQCMGSLDQKIHCYPVEGESSALPKSVFERWVKLCIQNGLMPKTTDVATEKNRHICVFNGAEQSAHTMYTALCCYRWSQKQPAIAWTVVVALAKNPKLDFFQALQYALNIYVQNSNHCFLPYNYGNQQHWNLNYPILGRSLVPAIAAKAFFVNDKSIKRKRATINEIELIWIKWGFKPPDLATVIAQDQEDILWSGWSELFRIQPDKKALTAAYEQIKGSR